jgi:hypothetical protein
MPRLAFRFDALNHEYVDIDTGLVYPHITGMLEETGWIDDTWYTEESSTRGTAVHRLTADYDLGALKVETCASQYRPWLLAYVKAVAMIRAQVLSVEEPIVHSRYKFGGRPDRKVRLMRAIGTFEIKTGQPERSHQIQTALQAILIAEEERLQPEAVQRHCLYISDNGKFKLEQHINRSDFDEALQVVRRCVGRAA